MNEERFLDLQDDELRGRLKSLACAERRITTELLLHLAEYDRRGLYVADGFSRLWDYCEKVLHLSENEIKLRIQAARAVQKNPQLREMLERGETSVTAIGRLAPHLDEQNAPGLIAQAKNKSQLEVRQLVAGVTMQKAVEARRLEAEAAEAKSPSLLGPGAGAPERPPRAAECSAFVRQRERDSITPVSATDWRVSFVAGDAFVKQLAVARALLARKFPEARLEDILGAVVEMFLDKADTSRRAAARRAKGEKKSEKARSGSIRRPAIAKAVRDAVFERDGMQCAFVGTEGRCPERRRLELDHVVPKAMGGPDTPENLRAACPRHNRFLAVMAFGASYIENAIRRRRQATGPP